MLHNNSCIEFVVMIFSFSNFDLTSINFAHFKNPTHHNKLRSKTIPEKIILVLFWIAIIALLWIHRQ